MRSRSTGLGISEWRARSGAAPGLTRARRWRGLLVLCFSQELLRRAIVKTLGFCPLAACRLLGFKRAGDLLVKLKQERYPVAVAGKLPLGIGRINSGV